MRNNNNKLKAFVRFDGSGRIIPSSLIVQAFKPAVGNYVEIDAKECCNYTTTTTSTTAAPTTTSTTTSAGPFNFRVNVASQGVLSPSANVTVNYSIDGGGSWIQYGLPLNPSSGYPNYNLLSGLTFPAGTTVLIGMMDSLNGNIRFGSGQFSGNFTSFCGLGVTPLSITTTSSDTDIYLNVAVTGGALVSC
jgi:hypothetical protein